MSSYTVCSRKLSLDLWLLCMARRGLGSHSLNCIGLQFHMLRNLLMLDPRKIACRLPDNLSSLPMAGDLQLLDLPRMGCMMLPYFHQ
jgi:hypothetical protein